MEPRLCKCHGEAMYLVRDRRVKGGSYWRCAVKCRDRNRKSHQDHREARRAQQKEYWHRADGGWLSERRRKLTAQRARIMEKLDQLAEERENRC